jgi:ribonuclease E
MTDDHQANSDNDHWNELARQLGLDAEPAASSRPTRRTAEEPAAKSAAPALAHADESRGENTPAQSEEREPDDEPASDESPRRQRGGRGRSGRRGRRSSRKDEEQPSAESSEGSSEPKEPSAERKGRRRGRRRRDTEAEETEAKREPVEATMAEEEDDRLEEVDTLSDWNVPSWNELIASLYRPER